MRKKKEYWILLIILSRDICVFRRILYSRVMSSEMSCAWPSNNSMYTGYCLASERFRCRIIDSRLANYLIVMGVTLNQNSLAFGYALCLFHTYACLWDTGHIMQVTSYHFLEAAYNNWGKKYLSNLDHSFLIWHKKHKWTNNIFLYKLLGLVTLWNCAASNHE